MIIAFATYPIEILELEEEAEEEHGKTESLYTCIIITSITPVLQDFLVSFPDIIS